MFLNELCIDVTLRPVMRRANADDINAAYEMGVRFLYGRGVGQDTGAAAHYLYTAAAQGHAKAQNLYGQIRLQDYTDNEGLKFYGDREDALWWFAKSAAQGNAWAKINLAELQLKDNNMTQAKQLLHEAATAGKRGNPVAQYLYAELLRTGSDMGEAMEAESWYAKAAQQGHGPAQYQYAVCLWGDAGRGRNRVAAFKWFQKAAKNGVVEAMQKLATLYAIGVEILVPKDEGRSEYWKEQIRKRGGVCET